MEIEIRNSASQSAAINTTFEGYLKALLSTSYLSICMFRFFKMAENAAKKLKTSSPLIGTHK